MEIGIYYHKIDYIRDYILLPTKARIERLCNCIDLNVDHSYQAKIEIIDQTISKLIDRSYEHVAIDAENRGALNPHIIEFYKDVYLILEIWGRFFLKMNSVFLQKFETIETCKRIDYCRSWLIKNIKKTFNYQN